MFHAAVDLWRWPLENGDIASSVQCLSLAFCFRERTTMFGEIL